MVVYRHFRKSGSYKSGPAQVGRGGEVYGTSRLSLLYLGSGGGSGGNGPDAPKWTPRGGKGGNGGGAIQLEARRLIEVTGKVRADGYPGEGDNAKSYAANVLCANRFSVTYVSFLLDVRLLGAHCCRQIDVGICLVLAGAGRAGVYIFGHRRST